MLEATYYCDGREDDSQEAEEKICRAHPWRFAVDSEFCFSGR